MQLPTIKCNTLGTQLQCAVPGNNTFYALNKGENAGKPLRQPCSNCFAVQCNSEQEMNYYYWLSWGLWTSKQFQPLLKGSVISFITIDDYRHMLVDAMRVGINENLLQKTIATMQDIERFEENSRERVRLLGQAKINLFRQVLSVKR